jgi:putative SOS response-associated peptidase YedK
MCGKFTQMASWREIHEFSRLFGANVNDEVVTYTPMRAVPVVHLDENGERRVSPMTWGFTERVREGRRTPKHMHARGETVHRLPTFAQAFHNRRAITFARTFNEGMEHTLAYEDGTPTGKSWTQQWTIRHREGRVAIIGVVFDAFDVGRGLEFEFVQVTVPANELISRITERMPLLLADEAIDLWLGAVDAPIEEVMALIRTREFDSAWEMEIEDPTKRPPKPRRR